MDAIICSRDRDDFLAATLGCLLTQTYPVETVHIIQHEHPLIVDGGRPFYRRRSYLLRQMEALFKVRGIAINWIIRSPTQALAHCRAEAIRRHITSEWVFMLDDDVWFDPLMLETLLLFTRTQNDPDLLAVGAAHIDVTNQRKYPDWDTSTYNGLASFPYGVFDINHHMFTVPMRTAYSNTHALWNVELLEHYAVLAMWENYHLDMRGYDFHGSHLAVTRGAHCYTIPNKAFWHLWLLEDKGYFSDVPCNCSIDAAVVAEIRKVNEHV